MLTRTNNNIFTKFHPITHTKQLIGAPHMTRFHIWLYATADAAPPGCSGMPGQRLRKLRRSRDRRKYDYVVISSVAISAG